MNNEFLKTLPSLPGVYLFKDAQEQVIYIGKAKDIRKRVSSYFRADTTDWKVKELIKAHKTIEHIITKTETEALLLEAQLIKKFKPKFNVLLKSGNPFIYIAITNEAIPQLVLRNKKTDKGSYFGPFLQRTRARSAYDYLMRTFKLNRCSGKISGGCLDYHLGKCAGNCAGDFNNESYIERINLAKELLAGNYDASKKMIEDQIKRYNQRFEFEKSKNLNEYLINLDVIFTTLKAKFTQTKYLKDITAVTTPLKYRIEQPLRALEDFQILLGTPDKIVSIDCFDISHFQSSYIVGSCIRFTHGIPDKNNFRRFRIKTLTEQNDFAALREIVCRRYKDPKDLPDVIIIDGGKGQLSAINNLPCVIDKPVLSLAKKEELLYTPIHPEGYPLNIKTPLGQLIIAIRDYAHHFAVSYHTHLRNKNFTLDS